MAAMAAKERILYHATDALILPTPRKYYRSYVHAHHWQLRSLISCPSPNNIYYPSGADVYRLNTKTQEREIFTTLPFSLRCLTVSNGWLLAGGDGGDYAAVRVDEPGWQSSDPFNGPDSRLDLDPLRRPYSNDGREVESADRVRNPSPGETIVTKIGTEIINCITVWAPGSYVCEEAYGQPVSVLSNNDHSVIVANLEDSEVLDTLQLDDCINRALISPDGRLLIAVGDDLYMHVFCRAQNLAETGNMFAVEDKPEYIWVRCPRVQLVGVGRADDACEQKGSFAATFSPSGRYLAVGTQYGVISIFEACHLTDQDKNPLIMTFSSAGSPDSSGAIRAMEFSPAPFDLLAWTEHNGKFGVADIRRDFISRQIIDIDMRADGMERVTIIERPGDLVIDPRLRTFRSNAESGRAEAEAERQQLQHLTREVIDRNQTHLTAEETEVLEALQVHRRHREREAAREALDSFTTRHPISWTDLADDLRRNGNADRQPVPNALPSSLREFVDGRSNDSLRAYITERNNERERRGTQPRRRGSVILAAAQNALDRDSTSLSESRQRSGNQHRLTSTSIRTGQDAPRLPAIGSDAPHSSNSPWAEIEALYNMAVDLPVDPTARMRVETETADSRREYTRSLQRHWHIPEERASLRHGERIFMRGQPPTPSETTGCAWSPDGRLLYIGAENGIFEYHVNSTGRRLFPSIIMR